MDIMEQIEAFVEEAFEKRLPQPGDVDYYGQMRRYAKHAARRTIANRSFNKLDYRRIQPETSFTGSILEAGVVNRKRGSRRRMPKRGISGGSLAAAV